MLTQNLIAALNNHRREEKISLLGINAGNAAAKNLAGVNGKSVEKILPYSVDLSAKAMQLHHADKNLQLSENYLSPAEKNAAAKKILTAENFIGADSDAGKLAHAELSHSLSQIIGEILTPYETYEAAQKNLWQKPVSGYTIGTDGANLTLTATQNLPGAFGLLANGLNNYLELFGGDNEYFSQLGAALDKLAPHGNDDLINQIKRMVNQVQSGSAIAIQSAQFRDDVTGAVAAAYADKNSRASDNTRHADKNSSLNRRDEYLSAEMQRREAEQQGELLDELLGKKSEHKSETPADILNRYDVEPPDHSIRDRLRKPDEPQEEFSFEPAQLDEPQPTKLPDTEFERRKNISSAWNEIAAENNWLERETP